jgi:pimeloyl-ACP methyl ester carboxylesterase
LLCVACSLEVCNRSHVVVLCHGLSGSEDDLQYLGATLKKTGASVYNSRANRMLDSLLGVREGGTRLAEEVRTLSKTGAYDRISFVGNSLGGLYARYAAKLLFKDGLIADMLPENFLLIASPSLGVRNYTYVDDRGLYVPDILKRAVAYTLRSSGDDLFLLDAPRFPECLVYQMACAEDFLAPLRAFKRRRLYANLDNDFVVPLGTAAMLSVEEVQRLRADHGSKKGIVHRFSSEKSSFEHSGALLSDPLDRMRAGLDSLGWDKHIGMVTIAAHSRPFSLECL